MPRGRPHGTTRGAKRFLGARLSAEAWARIEALTAQGLTTTEAVERLILQAPAE